MVNHEYALSPLQEGMLFHSQQAPGSGLYCNQEGYELSGALDADALGAAWRRVVARHDILRTGFVSRGADGWRQAVRPAVALEFANAEWRDLDAPARAVARQRWIENERRRGFDPSAPPLMRLLLARVDADVHELYWSVHHVLLDAWSRAIVLRDLWTAYARLVDGVNGIEPAAPPYRAYIDWLQRQDRDAADRFWAAALAGVDAPTRFDFADPERTSADERIGEITARWSSDETERLRTGARAEGITVNTIVQGAWACVLGRYASSRDVVFGVTVSGRPHDLPQVESMVGLFINTLPARVRWTSGEPVGAFLRRLQREQSESREHAFVPLVEVQRHTGVPSGTPLFDSVLVFENTPREPAATPTARLPRVRQLFAHERMHFPVALTAGAGRSLGIRLSFDRARVPDAVAQRLLDALGVAIRALASSASARMGNVTPVDGSYQLATTASGDDVSRAIDQTFLDTIVDRAATDPDRVAVTCGRAHLTYAALISRAGAWAATLRAIGVGPERLVGICLERSSRELLPALLGTLAAGGAYVPLDPADPPARLRALVETVELTALIGGSADATDWCRAARLESPDERRATATVIDATTPLDALAYVIFTSGSTGRPKPVCITRRSLTHVLVAMCDRPGVARDDVVLAVAALSFDIAVAELFLPLMAGARVVIVPDADLRDGDALRRTLARSSATLVQATPSTWQLLRAAGWDGGGTFRRWCGGEALTADLATLLRTGGREVWNEYGPTETTVWSVHQRVEAVESSVSLGRPFGGASAYAVDAEGDLCAPDVVGELWIGGAGVARGYAQMPGLTAERFVPDARSSSPGARAYRTGDRVRWRDGRVLEYIGRGDRQTKIRGRRVELGEIEAALAAIRGVRHAAALVRSDPHDGIRIVAFVAGERDAEEIRRELQDRVPPHLVPSALAVVPELPTNRNGKIDYRALAERPIDARTTEPASFQTPLEALVGGVFSEIVGVTVSSPDADFFRLGGHSISAMRAVARLREIANIELPIARFFEHPTVAGVAREIVAAALAADDVEAAALRSV
jgi:amino acid adenylation domain-containing protein